MTTKHFIPRFVSIKIGLRRWTSQLRAAAESRLGENTKTSRQRRNVNSRS